MKLDILVFAAHPDDAELACGGTILAQIAKGYKVGIIDLTRGELGTRGTAEIRSSEAATAAKILKVSVRENLEFADGFFVDDKEHQLMPSMIVILIMVEPLNWSQMPLSLLD
jgi:LmbE family N-acetylglucosaminyl deacetylase